MPAITLHHLNKSRSHRILWMLEELEVPYDIVEHKRDRNFRAPASLKAVHPLGKAPVVQVDDLVLAESGAVIEHLAEHLGDGRLAVPRDHEDYVSYRYFLHYAEGSLMPPLLIKLLMNRVRDAPVPFFIKPILRAVPNQIDKAYTDAELELHTSYLDAHLADRTWFVGDSLTAADIQLSYPVLALASRGGSKAPNLARWVEQMTARPAWKRALDKGGPTGLEGGF